MEIIDKVEQASQIVYSRDWACPCPRGGAEGHKPERLRRSMWVEEEV